MTGLHDHHIRSVAGSEYDADGFPGVQPDTYGPNSGSPPVEHHSPHGFLSRPLDPDKDGNGCRVHTYYEGSEQHCVLSHDSRVVAKLPILKKGESLLYGSAQNFVRLHEDGAVTMFTTVDGTTEGKSTYFRLQPDALKYVAPWGTMTFDQGGLHVLTKSGARLDLGGIGGMPSPLDQLGSYLAIKAATMTVETAAASFGDGAVPLVKQPEFAALLGLINGVLIAVGACLATATPASGMSGTNAAVATALALLESQYAALLLSTQATTSSA